MLFDLATAWPVEHKILLPGASVLARVVAGVRDRASARLWRRLSGASGGVDRPHRGGEIVPAWQQPTGKSGAAARASRKGEAGAEGR